MAAKFKLILVLNIVGAVFLIILISLNLSLDKKIKDYTVKIKEPLSKEKIDSLKKEVLLLKKKLKGLTEVFQPPENKELIDSQIFLAEKIDSFKKQLLRKAEAKGGSLPQIEISSSLPVDEEIPYYLMQLESLEKAIDWGLGFKIDFESVKIIEPVLKDGLHQLKAELNFKAAPRSLSDYLLKLAESEPFLAVDYLELREGLALSGVIQMSRILLDRDVFRLVSGEPSGFNYRESILIGEGLKTKFLGNKIFAQKDNQPPLPKVEVSSAPQAQRFFYRGRGILKGERVAALEDALRGEILFLTAGEKVDDFEVKEFDDNQLILENSQTSQRLILNRE